VERRVLGGDGNSALVNPCERITRSDGSVEVVPTGAGYTEFAGGLFFRAERGEWESSRVEPTVEAARDGSTAAIRFDSLSVPYRFSHSADLETVVESRHADGLTAASAVAALSYYDRISGQAVVVASPKPAGVQLHDRGVFYEDAFDHVQADIVYYLHPWGLEQDVVLNGNLPPPEWYGLNPDETMVVAMTELMGLTDVLAERDEAAGTEPSEERLEIYVAHQGGRRRVFNWQRSYAYPVAAGVVLGGMESAGDEQTAMQLRLHQSGGRLFLCEEVPFSTVAAASPDVIARTPEKHERPAAVSLAVLAIPARAADSAPAAVTARQTPSMAWREASPRRRFVFDYVDYANTVTNDLTLRSGHTYYISGPLTLSGAKLTIEPGSFIKLATNAQINLQSGATVDFKCHALDPALLTSAYDGSAGESILSGDPNANRYAAGLVFQSSAGWISGLRVRYARTGIHVQPSTHSYPTVKDVVFEHCDTALRLEFRAFLTFVRNCLIRECREGVVGSYGIVGLYNGTWDHLSGPAIVTTGTISSLAVSGGLFCYVTNRIFQSNVNVSASFYHNAKYQSTAEQPGTNTLTLGGNPFQVGTLGSNYLDQSCALINAGYSNGVYAGLYHYTTATNGLPETNSVVDIGFHYPTLTDSDGDGLPDFQEDRSGDAAYQTNSTDVSSWTNSDSDLDGLNDYAEYDNYGTNPQRYDSDADGQSDGQEVADGSNPLGSNSYLTTLSGVVSYGGRATGSIRVLARALPPTNGLAMFFSFATNQGMSVADLSGCGHTGAGTNLSYVPSGRGGWFDFSGATSYVKVVENPTASNRYTVALWFSSDSTNNFAHNCQLFSMNRRYQIGGEVRSNAFAFYSFAMNSEHYGDGTSVHSGTFHLEHDEWHHVALVVDGSIPQATFYLDGKPLGGGPGSGTVNTGNLDVLVGALRNDPNPGPRYYWDGEIDEVVIYDRALNASEVTNLFDLGVNAYAEGFTTLATTSAYTIANLPTLKDYTVTAFRDINLDGAQAPEEPFGAYAANPAELQQALGWVDIALGEADSDSDGMPDWWELKHGFNPHSGLTNGLAGWWKLDEGLGTNTYNSAGSGYHGGTVSMAATNWVSGKLGGALFFDGLNDYVRVPQNPAVITQAPFTLSTWVYYDTPAYTYFPSVISDGSWAGGGHFPGYLVRGDTNTGQMLFFAGSATSGTAIAHFYGWTNSYGRRWVHLAVSCDGSNAWIYADGVLKGSSLGKFIAYQRPEIWIGQGHVNAGSSYWRGMIDDVRIYRSLLSSNQIANLYDAFQDADHDALQNLDEYNLGPDPTNADTDADGLGDGEEVNTHGTDPTRPDTDGDALPDGWEVGYGLDPGDSSGANGAEGDPDGDSLSNGTEFGLGTDPTFSNTVVDVVCDPVQFEYKSIERSRSKCGFLEFVPSSPPKYYSRRDYDSDHSWGWDSTVSGSYSHKLESRHVTRTNDSVTCDVSCDACAGSHHSDVFYEPYEPCDEHAVYDGQWNACTNEVVIHGTYQSTDCETTNVQFTHTHPCDDPPLGAQYTQSSTLRRWTTNEVEDFGWGWIQYQQGVVNEELSDEYETAELVGFAMSDLENCTELSAVEWGKGVYATCTTGHSERTKAARDLWTDETRIDLTKIAYRAVLPTEEDTVYRLVWVERFVSEDQQTTNGVLVTDYITGDGGVQYTPAHEIAPPTQDGEISVVVLKVDSVDPHSSDAETHKIESVVSGGKDHFVCVKDTGDIVLNATVTPDDPAILDLITWEADGATINYPAVGTDKRTAKLSSTSSDKIPIRIKINGSTCWEGIVWVVWSTATAVEHPIQIAPVMFFAQGTGGYDFTFNVLPAAIITDADRPNLGGQNSTPVPGASQIHVLDGDTLAGGADKKWDASRQIRVKILNPHLYPPSQLPAASGPIWDNQPVAVDVPEDYPTDPTIGNDDTTTGDPENNDPYNNNGKVTSVDNVGVTMLHSTGVEDDTFERRLHFTEFLRVNLGDQWYRASDAELWRSHFKFKRDANVWRDDGSTQARDNTGF